MSNIEIDRFESESIRDAIVGAGVGIAGAISIAGVQGGSHESQIIDGLGVGVGGLDLALGLAFTVHAIRLHWRADSLRARK
jgi:hypothetical protein